MSVLIRSRMSYACRRAFTLIETLVVVSIIVLILALTGPSLLGTMQASRLTSAGDTVLGAFSEAQQMAMSLNLPIELRFFKYPTAMQQAAFYHSYIMLKVTTSSSGAAGALSESLEAIGSATRLPENVVILTGALSPLLESNPVNLPDAGGRGYSTYSGVSGAVYNAVRFLPDGTVRVVGATASGLAALNFPGQIQNCYVTIVSDAGLPAVVDNKTLPKNFYCIQLDPYTGKLRNYRPGQF